MFRKKQRHTEDIVEIKGYAPYSGITPKPYDVPGCLKKMESNLDQRIDAFLGTAHPDEFNGAYLDSIIDCLAEESIAKLYEQRAMHERIIIQMLDGQFQGDIKKCTHRIQLCAAELERLEKELVTLYEIYARRNRPTADIKTKGGEGL